MTIVEGDICDRSLLEKTLGDTTHLVHLAAQAGVRYSLVNPQAYVRANLEGFTNILELVRHNPAIKLCYASSSSVYGLNRKVPYSVRDPVNQQASFYGVTKRTNELMTGTYAHLYKIKAVGLRFFTVYGPWGRPDMALYSFTEAILHDKPIDIYNYGEMSRDFTYIDDIVAGTIAAIDYAGEQEIFNLGNHQPESLLHFVEILEQVLGKKAEKRLLPMQPGDIPITFADISESTQELGFLPRTKLEEGIPKFVDWYYQYNGIAKGGT